MPKAFAGPYVLKQRVGTLDPRELASSTCSPRFRSGPAIHRFPGAMAERVRELAGGRRSRTTAATRRASGAKRPTRRDLKKRIGALPGFGKMKVTALGSVLAKQFGVKLASRSSRPRAVSARSTRRRRSTLPGCEARAQGEAPCRKRLSSSGSAHTTRCVAAGRRLGDVAVRRRCTPRRSRRLRPRRRATARAASTAVAARTATRTRLVDEHWRARMPRRTAGRRVAESRAHYEFPDDLPDELAAELGPLLRGPACGPRSVNRPRPRLPLGRRRRALPRLVHGPPGADSAADRLVRRDLGRRAAAASRRASGARTSTRARGARLNRCQAPWCLAPTASAAPAVDGPVARDRDHPSSVLAGDQREQADGAPTPLVVAVRISMPIRRVSRSRARLRKPGIRRVSERPLPEPRLAGRDVEVARQPAEVLERSMSRPLADLDADSRRGAQRSRCRCFVATPRGRSLRR